MNCPYCQRKINAFTGLQELQKFHKHLRTCKKYPGNMAEPVQSVIPENPTATEALQVVRTLKRKATMQDALEIRAESGQ